MVPCLIDGGLSGQLHYCISRLREVGSVHHFPSEWKKTNDNTTWQQSKTVATILQCCDYLRECVLILCCSCVDASLRSSPPRTAWYQFSCSPSIQLCLLSVIASRHAFPGSLYSSYTDPCGINTLKTSFWSKQVCFCISSDVFGPLLFWCANCSEWSCCLSSS